MYVNVRGIEINYKFPTPPCGHTNNTGSLSYLVARSRYADWWLRIIMRTMFDAVAKPITSGIELCRANAPTALPTDYITETDDAEPTGISQIPQWQTHSQSRDPQEAPRFTRLQSAVTELCGHTTNMTSESLNINPVPSL